MADDVPAQLRLDARLVVQEELGAAAEIEAAASFSGRIVGVVEVQPHEVDARPKSGKRAPRALFPVVDPGEEQLPLPEVIFGASSVSPGTAFATGSGGEIVLALPRDDGQQITIGETTITDIGPFTLVYLEGR